MRLHVHRSGDAFLEALKTGNGCYYAAFDRSGTNPHVLRGAKALARERGHTSVASVAGIRADAERLMRAYFERASQDDPESLFAYSSRVLLAIPDYPDITLLFLLRALKSVAPESTVHALIENRWKADLVRFDASGGERPVFDAGGMRELARAARSAARGLLSRPRAGTCDVVIVTLGENVASGGTDAYFGELAAALAEKCRVITVYAAPGARLTLPGSDTIVPLEAFLGPFDAFQTWAARRSEDVAERTPDGVLTAYLRARERDSGEVAMLQVMARAFERMSARLKPHTIVYPFENRSWEKRLLRAARETGVTRCIGYQHSSITPRHLALSSAADVVPELPDAIITCGEVTAELLAAAIPEARSRVVAGPALRAKRLDVAPPSGSERGPMGLLAPISSSRAEAWEILGILHELASESSDPIVVRTHPTIPIDDLYAQFEWPAHVMLSRGRPLATDLAAATLVAYSSSTVALEGMLYGRLPVYLDIGDVPSGNPIIGEHPFVLRASSGRELSQAIERMRSLTGDELAALRAAARTYAERYLVEPSPANIERMAARIATFSPCA